MIAGLCCIGIAVGFCPRFLNKEYFKRIMMTGIISVFPVSYTHLDVYKRQAWSSVVLAFENSKRVSEEVKKPKALGDIRGVSYIYPILWRFGLIRVPEAIEKKMGKQR